MSLLNRAAVKKFILVRFEEMRAGRPMSRVSKEFLDTLEADLRNTIEFEIMRHPSIGKTFKP
ncbi:hypothetical protein LCGC14_0142460 [marine sediment metagenome]|uniref:Uncharacterized protein n=1 Tax=marine sediment metagenome TaxID=412755 RepID=A0A0F9XIG5_9ZZZZ